MPKAKTQPTPSTPVSHTLRRAYESVKAEADALSEHEIVEFRATLSIARGNAEKGIDAVLAASKRWAGQLGLSVEATERVLVYADAAEYAVLSSGNTVAPATGLADDIQEAERLRALLLSAATTLALAGLVPKEKVDRIRAGKGTIDHARDCVALADLFEANAEVVRGKSPITSEDLAHARAIGAGLLARLRGRGAKRVTHEDVRAARVARDRAWTLFERAWEKNVWLPGAITWLRHVDEHVPALGSRVRDSRKKADQGGPAKPKEEPKKQSSPRRTPTR